MTSRFKSLLLGALMASLTGLATAQSMPGAAANDCAKGHHVTMHEGMGSHMLQRMDRHLGKLKEQLKISAQQEPAWNTFVTAMKPAADRMPRHPDTADLAKLSTPERLDRMKALRSQHMADMNAAMDRREQATRALYESLTPEQKAQFDAQTARHHGRRGHHAG